MKTQALLENFSVTADFHEKSSLLENFFLEQTPVPNFAKNCLAANTNATDGRTDGLAVHTRIS
jgi:hypothetical protein